MNKTSSGNPAERDIHNATLRQIKNKTKTERLFDRIIESPSAFNVSFNSFEKNSVILD